MNDGRAKCEICAAACVSTLGRSAVGVGAARGGEGGPLANFRGLASTVQGEEAETDTARQIWGLL